MSKPNPKLFVSGKEVPDPPFRNLDEFTYEEVFKIGEETKADRARISDTFAALNALAGLTGMPADVRGPYEALIDAARGADRRESKTRRFICASWQAECYRTRAFIPPDAPDEEKQRLKASAARNWRRYGWKPVHQFQRETHLPFFEKEIYESGEGRTKKPVTVFHDRLTDLLVEIVRRARTLRGRRVDKFNRAAEACLAEFRRDVPAYAPDWTPEEKEEAPAKQSNKPRNESAEPAEIRSFRRSIQKWRKSNRAQLPEDAAAARRVLLAILDQEWPAEGESIAPAPVSYYADVQKIADAESESSSPPTFDGVCENANKKAQNDPAYADVFVRMVEPDLAEAERALEAFESVNADTFEVTLLDETKPKGSPPALFEILDPIALRKHLPRYLKRNETRPESLIIRVRSEYHLLQFDDLTEQELRIVEPFCFMTEWTSQGKGQGWAAIADEIDQDAFKERRARVFKSDKLRGTGANLGPAGSTRWPGSLNRKLKHAQDDGTAPRVTLRSVSPGRLTTFAELDEVGLLAPEAPPPPKEVRYVNTRIPDEWPDLGEYIHGAADRSSGEISWAMACLRRGWPQYAVVDRLRQDGPKAHTRRDKYAENTVAAAARYLASSPDWRANA